MMRLIARRGSTALAAALTVGALLGLSACSAGTEQASVQTQSTSSGQATQTTTGQKSETLTIEDPWVKAVDSGMSAAFGVLVNAGSEDITVVAATSDASPIMELHETVEHTDGQMIMREKDGGFVIPAGGSYTLQPGADHLMLMDVVAPIQAGEVVTFGLSLDDGSAFTFSATVKDYAGANETYVSE